MEDEREAIEEPGEGEDLLPQSTRTLRAHQRQAAMLEAFGTHTRSEIGDAVGVSTSAIKRWRKMPEYLEEIERCKKGLSGMKDIAPIVKRIRADVADATIKAVKALSDALEATTSKGEPAWGTRLRAAEALLGKGGVIIGTDQPQGGGSGGPGASAAVIVQVRTDEGRISGADVVDSSAEAID